MAREYIIIKQYMHSAIFPAECTKEYYKCTAAKRDKEALAADLAANADALKKAREAVESVCQRLQKAKAQNVISILTKRLERLYKKIAVCEAYAPKDYIIRAKKLKDKAEAVRLIEAAGLEKIMADENGIVWDTPARAFSTKYKGNIEIPSNIGY